MKRKKWPLLTLVSATALIFVACGEDVTATKDDPTVSSVSLSSSSIKPTNSSSSKALPSSSNGSVQSSLVQSSSSSIVPVKQSSSNSNAKIATEIAGYWIQTTGFSGISNRDIAVFLNDTIHIDVITQHNKGGSSIIYANTGKIGNDGPYPQVNYEYVISGDTLYAEVQRISGTPDGVVNKVNAIQYVRQSQYKEAALVDPAMIGAWKEVAKPNSIFPAGTKFLTITATTATYNSGYKDIVYGATATLYVRSGEIGERTGGVDTKQIGYALAQDTVWINDYGDQKRGLGTPFTK